VPRAARRARATRSPCTAARCCCRRRVGALTPRLWILRTLFKSLLSFKDHVEIPFELLVPCCNPTHRGGGERGPSGRAGGARGDESLRFVRGSGCPLARGTCTSISPTCLCYKSKSTRVIIKSIRGSTALPFQGAATTLEYLHFRLMELVGKTEFAPPAGQVEISPQTGFSLPAKDIVIILRERKTGRTNLWRQTRSSSAGTQRGWDGADPASYTHSSSSVV
jgi:hypothetical protein